MIRAQGGDPDAALPTARETDVITAERDGILQSLDALAVGEAAWRLGAGRARKEHAVQPGNDGLVVMRDGTKYVSSVLNGGVSRIRPGKPAELIARNIPSAASMCYDAGANQLVIPMNPNNGLAFVPLGRER